MEKENDRIRLEVEAQPELSQPEIRPERRGFASLRGVRRSTYLRRSLLRMLTKSPEELEAYRPANYFEMIAKNLVTASSKGKDGALAVQVWRLIRETLGEPIGSNWKDTQEHAKRMPRIINDLPHPDYSCYIRPNADDEKAN